MLHGRCVHDWGQTGSVLALLANINRDPRRRRRAFGVSEFMPSDLRPAFRQRRGGVTRAGLRALKPLFQKGDK